MARSRPMAENRGARRLPRPGQTGPGRARANKAIAVPLVVPCHKGSGGRRQAGRGFGAGTARHPRPACSCMNARTNGGPALPGQHSVQLLDIRKEDGVWADNKALPLRRDANRQRLCKPYPPGGNRPSSSVGRDRVLRGREAAGAGPKRAVGSRNALFHPRGGVRARSSRGRVLRSKASNRLVDLGACLAGRIPLDGNSSCGTEIMAFPPVSAP